MDETGLWIALRATQNYLKQVGDEIGVITIHIDTIYYYLISNPHPLTLEQGRNYSQPQTKAWKILKMSHTLHIIFYQDRHVLQQSQCDTSAQGGSFGEIDEIFETETQSNSLGKLYRNIVGGSLWIIIGFQSNLSVSNISLAREFDTSL